MTLETETPAARASTRDPLAAALAHATANEQRSNEALTTLVRIPSLTGEEGKAQRASRPCCARSGPRSSPKSRTSRQCSSDFRTSRSIRRTGSTT